MERKKMISRHLVTSQPEVTSLISFSLVTLWYIYIYNFFSCDHASNDISFEINDKWFHGIMSFFNFGHEMMMMKCVEWRGHMYIWYDSMAVNRLLSLLYRRERDLHLVGIASLPSLSRSTMQHK